MSAIDQDFDALVERADAYGALWATRILRRLERQRVTPREWPGTIDEARRVVDAFAGPTAFTDRERLAAIVQHSAEGMWTDSVRPRGRLREVR
jgi:hypothetical protein